jgi:hypothetical protein
MPVRHIDCRNLRSEAHAAASRERRQWYSGAAILGSIHGLEDTVVPFKQSSFVFEALTGAHKNVQLVELKTSPPKAGGEG